MSSRPLAVLALCAAGCDGVDLGACPPASDAQQDAGRSVVSADCVRCHSPEGTNASAFEAYDFTDLAVVREAAEDMYGQAEQGDMPPDRKLTPEELEALRVYLACGAPE